MTVAEIISRLKTLDASELTQIRVWLEEHEAQDETSPALLAALDEGIADIEAGRLQEFTREELAAQVKVWAGGSR